jgi:carbon-monoxide dehydrogenase large subunit
MAPIKFGVGQSVPRKADDALIRGRGRYTDDFAPQPALHALVLRSPHAHAKRIIAPVGISFSCISVGG